MQRRQAWMREYLLEEGHEALSFVGSATRRQQTGKIAELMRTALGIDTGWAARYGTWTDALRGLQKRMESIGILVVVNGVVGNNTHRKLDPGEFRGFVLVDNYAPLVFVNGADSKAAQMFTLGHELAHIFFGRMCFLRFAASSASRRTCRACVQPRRCRVSCTKRGAKKLLARN